MTDVADKEKKTVALSSVLAAILLTGMKLVVGVWSGSLGILSEAAHSGLDLIAAIITYVAVRSSGKPADEEHLYGHEKIENLSALFETALLFITCLWIIYEAFRRLLFSEVHVEATVWAFGVMILSIIIDSTRSRALMRAAKKHNSQALEADALHFSTDVWSSCVVLFGLGLVWIGDHTGTSHILSKADPLAALGVACIVIYVSYQLGRRCIGALLDSAPPGLARELEAIVRQVSGVKGCHRLRVRQSGKQSFVDLSIDVEKGLSVSSAHQIAETVKKELMSVLPHADVLVGTDPFARIDGDLNRQIRSLAESLERKVHNIFVYQQNRQLHAELHLEVSLSQSIFEAHKTAMDLEDTMLREIPTLKSVDIHIEPSREESYELRDVTKESGIEKRVCDLVCKVPEILDCHDVIVRQNEQGLYLSMHAIFNNDLSMEVVHSKLSDAEKLLFQEFSNLQRVLIHPEPLDYSDH